MTQDELECFDAKVYSKSDVALLVGASPAFVDKVWPPCGRQTFGSVFQIGFMSSIRDCYERWHDVEGAWYHAMLALGNFALDPSKRSEALRILCAGGVSEEEVSLRWEKCESRWEHDSEFRPVKVWPVVSGDRRIVSADPRVCFGKPVMGGTRIPVRELYSRWSGGDSITALAREFALVDEDVELALQWLARRGQRAQSTS